MNEQTSTPNKLINETSPYLLQHAHNPVSWYPWGEEAFEKARREDKPVFLSIGYSTCHWCHVMAHESFEDQQVANALNRDFVSIKVDKEERPDVDSVYMAACQAFTGGGGWPLSVFLTPEQKPFYAGTYFPKEARYGMVGFLELLRAVSRKWKTDRGALIASAERALDHLNQEPFHGEGNAHADDSSAMEALVASAAEQYRAVFDEAYGGFGSAPKFPAAHNLLFLLALYEKTGDGASLAMAEKTLERMYHGGLFDQIGYGFCRYSTDRAFLAPHFEKMLYDNALLILAYAKAFAVTGKALYGEAAERTAQYLLREMQSPLGGFYSAQDADSDGVEGKYYLFEPKEILELLGKEAGAAFCARYDITEKGNFEGKSIPNLLRDGEGGAAARFLPRLYEYRKGRYRLHLDDKILAFWNGLAIAALCALYRITANGTYLDAAKRAQGFLQSELAEGTELYASWREGKRGAKGFLEDYAGYAFALLALYEATLEEGYLALAQQICQRTVSGFFDFERGGFFQYGAEHERLVIKPKETYDGAAPSGNSLMAYNMVRLSHYGLLNGLEDVLARHLAFLTREAEAYPMGHAMLLSALLEQIDPPQSITIVPAEGESLLSLPPKLPLGAVLRAQNKPSAQYPLLDGKTAYYACEGRACRPPVSDPALLFKRR